MRIVINPWTPLPWSTVVAAPNSSTSQLSKRQRHFQVCCWPWPALCNRPVCQAAASLTGVGPQSLLVCADVQHGIRLVEYVLSAVAMVDVPVQYQHLHSRGPSASAQGGARFGGVELSKGPVGTAWAPALQAPAALCAVALAGMPCLHAPQQRRSTTNSGPRVSLP